MSFINIGILMDGHQNADSFKDCSLIAPLKML